MNIVVTGGGTIAPIDSVRLITNVSSGRFSAQISEACVEKGAHVWHLHAPTAELPFQRRALFDLETADEETEINRLRTLRRDWLARKERLQLIPCGSGTVAEYADCLERVLTANSIDIAFLAMAVSDYESRPIKGKIESRAETLQLSLVRTPKIIQSVKTWSPNVFLVGFKLTSNAARDDLIRQAEIACEVNRADVTVANDLSTLQASRHTIHLVRLGQPVETIGPGPMIAEQLVDRVVAWASQRPR